MTKETMEESYKRKVIVSQTSRLSSEEVIRTTRKELEKNGYIATDQIATALYLAQALVKPILIEGPPGVGKTELAIATSKLLDKPLIRLQCYEGLDESKALYEWKYGKQLLYTQVLKEKLSDMLDGARDLTQAVDKLHAFDDIFFSEAFVEPRPLLKALWEKNGAVLLIDEIDKSDQEFEAFLLEILENYQISIPEIGTVRAKTPPVVFLTSNNTREIGDALKRRCLHLYIPFPEHKLEQKIIETQIPDLPQALSKQVVNFVQSLRKLDLKKIPSISETLDWARALTLLNATDLQPQLVRSTLNLLLKFQDDIEHTNPEVTTLVRNAIKDS